MGAWICLLGAWTCLLGAWTCLLGVPMPQQSLHLPGCQTEIAEQSRQPSQETKILNIFLQFFGPGTSPRGFASPRRRISSPKLFFLMRMCRGIEAFVALMLNFQAVIKSAASEASAKTKIQESRGASERRLGMRTAGTARLLSIPGFWSSRRLRLQQT